MKKTILILFTCIVSIVHGQTLPGVADSIFMALRYEEFDSVKKFIPSYRELKTTYDSLDMERQEQQILIDQQTTVYYLGRSFKTLKKEANKLKVPLKQMEKDAIRHLVLTHEGKKYSIVEVDCHYKKRYATIFYTVIELNDAWYLAEEFKIIKREIEETPDYDKIDREAERKREKREQEKLQAREEAQRDSVKAAQDSIKDAEKAERDSIKAAKKLQIETEKAQRDSVKKAKAAEKARLKEEREAEKKRKKEEAEQKKKKKETPKKPEE